MKILVTGGCGFIASHITDTYIELGHQVAVIDNFATGKKKNLSSKAAFYEVDIRDTQKVEEIVAKEKPEIINHHAAQLDVRKSVADPVFDAQVNILGILNLLEAGRKNNIKKFIFASSGGVVYGDATIIPTPENYQPLTPVSPYGVSKLTSELYLSFYQNTYNVPFVALRYANIYGPRQDPHGEAGVVAIFTKALLTGTQPTIFGDGTQVRDYTCVFDVVSANVAALDDKVQGIFNIGTGIGTNVNELFGMLVKLIGGTVPEQHGPQRPGEQKKSILDTSKANQTFGWKATMPLEAGLKETVAFFKNEKEN